MDYTLCDNLPLSHTMQYRRTAKFEVPNLVTMNIHEEKGNVFVRQAKTVLTRQNVLYNSKWHLQNQTTYILICHAP